MFSYNPLEHHARYLKLFWGEFGTRRERSLKPKKETIRALQMAGHVFIYYSIKGTTTELQQKMIQKSRQKFDSVKDIRQRYKFRGGEPCFACGEPANVRHHIIWLKHGGRNNKRNICFLCRDCHAEIHPWLKQK